MSLELFVTTIKPYCEKFFQNPTQENVIQLTESLKNLEGSQLDMFQSYILLPLIVKIEDLTEDRNAEIKTSLVRCIDDIISKIRIKNLKAFKTILIVILKQIHDFAKGCLLPNLSEERKLAVMNCISTLFQRTLQEVLIEFYANENSYIMAKIGVTCVELISKEKYRTLRIASIKCLLALFFVHDNANFDDVLMRSQVANTTFIFLPKIIQTLIDISMGDSKLGENLISISVSALGRILCLVFEDYEKSNDAISYNSKDFLELLDQSRKINGSDDEILFNSLKERSNIEEKIKSLQNTGRTDEWLRASSRKLSNILRRTSKIRAHESKKVRAEYAILCCNLTEKCFKYLKENFLIFLETIIAFCEDDDVEIRSRCNECISNLLGYPDTEFIFKESVSVLFEMHLNHLPTIINRCDDVEQRSELLFMKGFFSILPEEQLRMIFTFCENTKRFCMYIIAVLDLELQRSLLVEEYALRTIAEKHWSMSSFPWRRFKKMNDTKNVELLRDICNILGQSFACNFIFDELISLLPRNMHICNEILIYLIFLLAGGNLTEGDIRINHIHVVLEEILQEIHWHLALKPDPMVRVGVGKDTQWFVDSTPGLYESAVEIRLKHVDIDEELGDDAVSINDAQFNVLHTCVVLDAIGSFSLCLGKFFQQHVFRCLHKVLLKAASSNCMVHESATYALNRIRKALGFEKISDVIHNFFDYISYHINILLKKADKSRDASDILSVVLQFTSIESLPHIENIISTILDESTKPANKNNLPSYFKVFQIIFSHLNKWEKEISAEVESQITDRDDEEMDEYTEWLRILNKKEEVDGVAEDGLIEPADDNNDELLKQGVDEQSEELPKEQLPWHIKISVEILQKISKFVSSKDQVLKIISMDCLICGLPLLRNYENELLPIVHLIWDPLSQRFKDKDPVVLGRCLTLFNTLVTYSKDFLLSRSLKDVVSFLCDFLKSAADNSARDINLAETQEFKLQTKLLEEFPNIIVSMGIQEMELDAITDVVLLYLNKKQPEKLQQLTLNYFNLISKYNRPLLYVKLVHLEIVEDFKENIIKIFDIMR